MSKQQSIDQFLTEPVKVGDIVSVPEPTSRNPENRGLRTVIASLDNDVWCQREHHKDKFDVKDIIKDTSHIGSNPFREPFRADQYNIDMWQLLFRMGWDYERAPGTFNPRHQRIEEWSIPEVNFNSTIVTPDGRDTVYQRDLVWPTEVKQLLIESIYNGIEIGKFVIRNRSWSWVEKRMREGKVENTAFADVVDGKQRINTLLDFVLNKFPDLHGNYWCDLSLEAQRRFQKFNKFAYFEISEKATDSEVLEQFLAVNFAGVPMSMDHIQYVKSIKPL